MPDPKIEPWMTAAAEEIEALSDALCGAESMMAALIARHAPDPASVPIGPGDVVQVVERIPYQLVGGYPDFDVSELLYVREVEGENIIVYRMHMSVSIPRAYVTRIGRAVYWPDGTKVEVLALDGAKAMGMSLPNTASTQQLFSACIANGFHQL